jgi:uncharacterized membrane protein
VTTASVERLERVIGRLLRIGVSASSVCLTAGLLMTFAGSNSAVARALLAAGIVVLLATPVVRVGISSVGYARRRDWLFVALTLVVFAELIATILATLAT